MQFEKIFDKITNNLIKSIIEYMQNKITIDELVDSCQLLINYLRFYDNFIDI